MVYCVPSRIWSQVYACDFFHLHFTVSFFSKNSPLFCLTGGTAPSSFGKFRGGDHQSVPDVMGTEDEEDDEENGLSLCESEYGEGLLQTPGAQYFIPNDPAVIQDWLPAAHHTGETHRPLVYGTVVITLVRHTGLWCMEQ